MTAIEFTVRIREGDRVTLTWTPARSARNIAREGVVREVSEEEIVVEMDETDHVWSLRGRAIYVDRKGGEQFHGTLVSRPTPVAEERDPQGELPGAAIPGSDIRTGPGTDPEELAEDDDDE